MSFRESPKSFVLAATLLCACSKGTYDDSAEIAQTTPIALPENVAFELSPEFTGPCKAAIDTIDVNLGNSPEAFVRAASCQISGVEANAAVIASWASKLRTTPWLRRIDVVRSLCSDAQKNCSLAYSDPWEEQVLLTAPCVRKTTRDIGAVMMFFSECPIGVNCTLDWANTHVSGMQYPHPLYAFGDATGGYYHPDNPGFWKRELLDARWAGLQFVLLNTYGPDLGHLSSLSTALTDIGGGIGIALFDDTSGWNASSEPPWNTTLGLLDSKTEPKIAEQTAQAIYNDKWKPFFSAVPHENWYLVKGRPFIYFYNAGTLNPLKSSAALVARLKQLFTADFGVEPFVAVDTAYFQDPGMPAVADSEFIWNTIHPVKRSHFEIKGVSLDHFMVKWDSLGRDNDGAIATQTDGIVKGPELLTQAMTQSAASDLAVFATWNDLGEGTAINRNYDYYYQGQWLTPHAFMSILRDAQCE